MFQYATLWLRPHSLVWMLQAWRVQRSHDLIGIEHLARSDCLQLLVWLIVGGVSWLSGHFVALMVVLLEVFACMSQVYGGMAGLLPASCMRLRVQINDVAFNAFWRYERMDLVFVVELPWNRRQVHISIYPFHGLGPTGLIPVLCKLSI